MLALLFVVALMVGLMPAMATGATGDGFKFEVDSGGAYAYNHVPQRQNDADSGFDADFSNVDGVWTVDFTLVSPDAGTYVVATGIAGQCAPTNTEMFEIVAAAEDVDVVGTWSGSHTPAAGWNFIRVYPKGQACLTRWAANVDQPYGMITAPPADSIQMGVVDFGATYYDNDFDEAQWAVRKDTCAAGSGNYAGGGPGVSGVSDPYMWNGRYLSASVDTTGWPAGYYCFVFNTQQDSHEDDVRLTRWFYISDGSINGGGQILEVDDPNDRKSEVYKISFGGWLYTFGSGDPMCEWQVNFHNVSVDDLDKGKFHGTSCTRPGDFPTGGADGVTNFAVYGSFNGMPGYTLIIRMEDRTEPGFEDTIRFELLQGTYTPGNSLSNPAVYDSSDKKPAGHAGGDFTSGSNNSGTARTLLDNGNLQINL